MKINREQVLLEGKNIYFSYTDKKVVNNVSFSLREGEVLGVIGESGSGKSSLLKLMAGLLLPAKGTLKYRSESLKGPDEKLVPGHDRIKLVRQDFDLMPYLSVEDNILRDALSSGEQARKRLLAHYKKNLGIRSVAKSNAENISGGQKQRTALASALAASPEVLLLDEPFSNLDYTLRQDVIRLLKNEWRAPAMIVVTHEPADIIAMADRLLVMRKGRIVQSGSTEKVFKEPKDVYTARLLGQVNVLSENDAEKLGAGQKKFVRPHELQVSERRSGMQVTVEDCTYRGAEYELEVSDSTLERNLIVNSSRPFSKGSAIRISFPGCDIKA